MVVKMYYKTRDCEKITLYNEGIIFGLEFGKNRREKSVSTQVCGHLSLYKLDMPVQAFLQ